MYSQFCCNGPGKLVTREELRNQNWPADTFVDFDNGLNTCITQLREALGDAADSPRFIETLPRRGYRFIAPVIGADGTATGTAAGMDARPRGRKIVVAAAVVALAAGIAGGLLWRARQARRLTEKTLSFWEISPIQRATPCSTERFGKAYP